eukprot:SAG31_NODE_7900_length_1569_cov_4.458503_1_plen_96_part_00
MQIWTHPVLTLLSGSAPAAGALSLGLGPSLAQAVPVQPPPPPHKNPNTAHTDTRPFSPPPRATLSMQGTGGQFPVPGRRRSSHPAGAAMRYFEIL